MNSLPLVIAISREFAFLKSITSIEKLYTCGIPLHNGGMLFPICELMSDDPQFIARLSEWRQENEIAYPTRFTVTHEGTVRWLKQNLLSTEDKILFLIKDKHGHDIGHLGFANCNNEFGFMEIDNVIRGVKGQAPGIMKEALIGLMEWARTTFGPDEFYLRVLASNIHAHEFYRKVGFIENYRQPLRYKSNTNIQLLENLTEGDIQPPDDEFIRMSISPGHQTIPGSKMILTAGPSISQREGHYAYDAARRGWNNEWSKYLSRFEIEFGKYVGANFAMATSSCTGALTIALTALDIGPGDEVIVPDETWVATANAVRYVGATPIFCDVEIDTWNMDVNSVERLISTKTKAIMPVHMYGHPARMDQIMALAKQYNLYVIEDAAPAIGAEWQGQRCGSFGDFAAFSFQGAKLMVTGEGGMLVCKSAELYQKALKIWDQGRNPNKVFWIDGHGVKYKMSNVQAAIGLGQLERCDELIRMKRRVFSWYETGLKNQPWVHLNREVDGAHSIYWMTSLRLDEAAPVTRDEFCSELKNRNIDTRPVFPAISQYPIWGRSVPAQPVAQRLGLQALNLPSGVGLSKEEVDYICRQIRDILK